MKIRTKLFIANLLVVLFLLGSLSYIWVERSTDLIMKNINETAELTLSQISTNLSSTLLSYEEIVNTLYSDNTLQKEFLQSYSDIREAYDIYFNKQLPFERAILTTKDVHRIDFYTENESYVFSNVYLINDAIKKSDWYNRVMNRPNSSFWSPPYMSANSRTNVFSIKKRLNNLVKSSNLMVSVEINMRVLYSLVQEESKDKRYIFTLNDGTILLDSQNEKLSSIYELPYADQIMANQKGNIQFEQDGNAYSLLYQTLNARETISGIKVMSIVKLDRIMSDVIEMRKIAITLFVSACFISIVVIYIFSVGLTKRLSELSIKMRRVDRDNFQSSVEVRGNDEISTLGNIFNSMVRRISQLIKEVYQAEIDRKELALRTKEVELYALQTQINPHFLFNILNMIRGKLLIKGDRDTAKVVGLLAKSFRMMLRGGGQTIQLEQEVEFIDNYLSLQQYRYEDKLQYEINIQSEHLSIEIPRLCLQPLVENSVSHGIELKESPSCIKIYSVESDSHITLIVEDNGLGIAPDRLEEIQSQLLNDSSITKDKHIGLKNVNQRIQYLYGEQYGLSIDSQEGVGTKVSVTIPLKRNNGDDHYV